jgi:hypothetical protein
VPILDRAFAYPARHPLQYPSIITCTESGKVAFFQLSTGNLLCVHDFAASGMREEAASICCWYYDERTRALAFCTRSGALYSYGEELGSYILLHYKPSKGSVAGAPIHVAPLPRAGAEEGARGGPPFLMICANGLLLIREGADVQAPVLLAAKQRGFIGRGAVVQWGGGGGTGSVMVLTSTGMVQHYDCQLVLQWYVMHACAASRCAYRLIHDPCTMSPRNTTGERNPVHREFNLMRHLPELRSLQGVSFARNGHVLVADGYTYRTFLFEAVAAGSSKPQGQLTPELRIYSRQREPSATRAIQRESRRSVVRTHKEAAAPVSGSAAVLTSASSSHAAAAAGAESNNRLLQGLQERGEKLERIEKSSGRLADGSATFLSTIQAYNKTKSRKKWYEL